MPMYVRVQYYKCNRRLSTQIVKPLYFPVGFSLFFEIGKTSSSSLSTNAYVQLL